MDQAHDVGQPFVTEPDRRCILPGLSAVYLSNAPGTRNIVGEDAL